MLPFFLVRLLSQERTTTVFALLVVLLCFAFVCFVSGPLKRSTDIGSGKDTSSKAKL